MKLRFLVESGVARSVSDQLQEAGFQVSRLDEGPDPGDKKILALSVETKSILVTADKDFGERIYRLGERHCGVILIDSELSPAERNAGIRRTLENHADALARGDFIRLKKDRIRVRPQAAAAGAESRGAAHSTKETDNKRGR